MARPSPGSTRRPRAGISCGCTLRAPDPYDRRNPSPPRVPGDRPYDGEVAWTDSLVVARRALGKLGLRDDPPGRGLHHSEGLGEHGEKTRTDVRLPEQPAGASSCAAAAWCPDGHSRGGRGVDLFPTGLDLLGVEPPAGTHVASSLAAVLRRAAAGRRRPPTPNRSFPAGFGWSDLRGAGGRWKYTRPRGRGLYDLREDPERRATSLLTSPEAEAMRRGLGALVAQERTVARGDVANQVCPRTCSRSSGPSATWARGPPPRPQTQEPTPGEGRRVQGGQPPGGEGLQALRRKEYASSASSFRAAACSGITASRSTITSAGARGIGRCREAVPGVRGGLERLPGCGAAYWPWPSAACRRAIRGPRSRPCGRGGERCPGPPPAQGRKGACGAAPAGPGGDRGLEKRPSSPRTTRCCG